MNSKFMTIARREYVQGVRSKVFIISTILGPVMMFVFTVVPGLLFQMKTGDAMRVAILDETGRLYDVVREAVTGEDAGNAPRSDAGPRGIEGAYRLERVEVSPGAPTEEAQRLLDERIRRKELDAYVILPRDILETNRARYYALNLGDLISIGRFQDRLGRAVKEQKMREAGLDPGLVNSLSRGVEMSRHRPGEQAEQAAESGFFLALAVGLFVYIAILMYGQVILSAIVEEKTTRIVEVLFSSVDAFTLMAGKLVGVSLVGLTQYVLWALLFVGAALFTAGGGAGFTLPHVPPMVALYSLLFFLLGFYVYATLYAVVGSMVTTEKEGGQLAFPVIMLLMAAIYVAFPVIRSPSSTFSFWASMIPFFSPITMIVRIATEPPPWHEVALSLLIGFATVVGLLWVAARIYRTGMLMYGKRPTLRELGRWIRAT